MLGLSAYIFVDTFFIAREMGAYGLASLNLAIPIYSIVFALGLMIGIGGATKFAVLKSRNKTQEANRVFTNAVILTALASIFFLSIGVFFSETITRLFGAYGVVFEMTLIYLRVILLSSPLFLFTALLTSFIRNDGFPVIAMGASLISSLSNIFFDYILIVEMQMGMFGAALATTLAASLGLLFIAGYFIIKRSGFRLIKCNFSGKLSLNIFSIGLPACISEISVGIVIITFNLIIMNLLDNVGVAAYAIVANISVILIAIYNGVAQGMQPLISRNHGRGHTHNIRTVMSYGLITVGIISTTFYLFAFFGASAITSIFNSENDPLLQAIATDGIRIFFIGCIFVGFNIVLSTYFTATEYPRPAQIFSILRGFLIIVPVALLLSAALGITGVWLALPVAESAVTLIAVVMYVRTIRRAK
jgi:putative MATE family efflux protein